MGSIRGDGEGGSGKKSWHWAWQDIGDESKRMEKMNTAPSLLGLPAIPKAGMDASDIATKEAAVQGLNQRMQGAQMNKFALGDPSQTPIGTKTLLGS